MISQLFLSPPKKEWKTSTKRKLKRIKRLADQKRLELYDISELKKKKIEQREKVAESNQYY